MTMTAETVTGERWITVTDAAAARGVTRRTVKRWVAENRLVSRLERAEGRELRLIREDTLPSATGDVSTDDSEPRTDGGHREKLNEPESSGTDDRHGCGTRDPWHDTVTRQAEEISFLRAQLESRGQEAGELRRLLLHSQQTAQLLADQLQQRSLPPHVETAPRRRWFFWRSR